MNFKFEINMKYLLIILALLYLSQYGLAATLESQDRFRGETPFRFSNKAGIQVNHKFEDPLRSNAGQVCESSEDCEYPLKCDAITGTSEKFCTRKQCMEDNDCVYPLKCIDPENGEGSVCSRSPCTSDDECVYPLKCLNQSIGEGFVCSRVKCSWDSDCDYHLKCVFGADGEGKVCTRSKCTISQDCKYPSRCEEVSHIVGKVCIRKACVDDSDCEYSLKCLDVGGDEGFICAQETCSNDTDCQHPLKCLDRDHWEGNVCSNGRCGNDEDCHHSLVCVNHGYFDGSMCSLKRCEEDEHCSYPLKCVNRGSVDGKVCFPCDCGLKGTCKWENRQKICDCDPGYEDKDGMCTAVETSTLVTTDSSSLKTSLITTDSSSLKTTLTTSIVPICYCGPETKSCYLNSFGDKSCNCLPGYVPVNGYCVGICNEDKCVHGKCEIVGNSFKCRCNEGYSGLRCEDKIQTISNKQVILLIIQISIALATFILLVGGLCVLVRIRNKVK